MSYDAHDVAAADQHYAMVNEDLDDFITSWKKIDDRNVQDLDVFVDMLACPHMDDGTEIDPREHIGTLSNLLAAAIDRLARQA